MTSPKNYKDNFYNVHMAGSIQSAREIVPYLIKLIQPESVIDIGCGVGTWLKVWKENNIVDIKGIDGEYVLNETLLIDKNEFIPFDLEKGFTSERKYDIVSCLEVAEHIRKEYSDTFIASLCKLSDIVLFSAAIPGQEGTFHFNEQYPDYWQKKFNDNGFRHIDSLRYRFWNNDKIDWWYRQNIILYIHDNKFDDLLYLLKDEPFFIHGNPLKLVHPDLFEYKYNKSLYYESVIRNPFSFLKFYVKSKLAAFKESIK